MLKDETLLSANSQHIMVNHHWYLVMIIEHVVFRVPRYPIKFQVPLRKISMGSLLNIGTHQNFDFSRLPCCINWIPLIPVTSYPQQQEFQVPKKLHVDDITPWTCKMHTLWRHKINWLTSKQVTQPQFICSSLDKNTITLIIEIRVATLFSFVWLCCCNIKSSPSSPFTQRCDYGFSSIY